MSPENTAIVSFGGAALVALLPKLIDVILGARIAQKKEQADRDAAYRQTVFTDAAKVREERAAFQAELIDRVRFLEARNRELEGELDDTKSKVWLPPTDRPVNPPGGPPK